MTILLPIICQGCLHETGDCKCNENNESVETVEFTPLDVGGDEEK